MSHTAEKKPGYIWDVQEISDQGERVTHLAPDHVFYGHLSIYHFAFQYVRGAAILDAGSGSGYGSAYLADSGAKHVTGLELNARAVEFSRYHFQRPNLDYQVMDLGDMHGLPPRHFDLIFSSNTLEHVPGIRNFFHSAWELLKPGGTLLLAVPPVTDQRLEYLNLINPYHLHIWSPRQWSEVLQGYFGEVTPYLHGVGEIGQDFAPEHYGLNKINQQSFAFKPGTLEDMYKSFTLTAIFLAHSPLPEEQIPAPSAPIQFVDGSYSRPAGYIDSQIKHKLRRYFKAGQAKPANLITRAYAVLRGKGLGAFLTRIASYPFRKR